MLAGAQVCAQAQIGTLSGTVRDSSQAIVAGAHVSLRRAGTDTVLRAETGGNGRFRFTGVPTGVYTVEVQAAGFGPFSQPGVTIAEGQAPELNIGLPVGSATASVEVTASPYEADTASVAGPFVDLPLQDTPYSINVITEGFIQSIQASTVDQLFRLNPFVEDTVPQTRSGSGVGYIRGFSASLIREDGLYAAFPIVDIEDKQSVEVLTGQSGFLYGVNPPGGLVNYELKRPTPTRLNSLQGGSYGGASLFGHGDFAGPIDHAGRLAYRANLLGQGGATAIQDQNLTRGLASGVLDWHVSPAALLRFDTSHSSYRVDGSPAVWQIGSAIPIPPPPRGSLLYGQRYDFNTYSTNKSGVRGTWEIDKTFTLRGGADRLGYQRHDFYTNNVFAANHNDSSPMYSSIVLPFAPRNITTYSGQAFVDAKWNKGFAKNLFTFGYDGDVYRERRHEDQSAVLTLASGIPYPQQRFLPEPTFAVGVLPSTTFSRTINRNILLADVLNLGKHWIVLGGGAYDTLVQQNFTVRTGRQSALYSAAAWTPSISVEYKPVAQVTTYFTYIQGLQQGAVAPDNAANPGVALPPAETTQYELGAKASLGRSFVTLAAFNIDEPFQFLDPADDTFKQGGRERHKGVELGLTGEVYRGLNLYGGITLLDPRVEASPTTPAIDNSRPPGVAKQLYKLSVDDDLPRTHGFGVTGSIVYTGRSPENQPNTFFVPSFATGDLGVRYQWIVRDRPITLRANATNITNKNYWLASLVGTNLYTGDPRSIAASLQTRF